MAQVSFHAPPPPNLGLRLGMGSTDLAITQNTAGRCFRFTPFRTRCKYAIASFISRPSPEAGEVDHTNGRARNLFHNRWPKPIRFRPVVYERAA